MAHEDASILQLSHILQMSSLCDISKFHENQIIPNSIFFSTEGRVAFLMLFSVLSKIASKMASKMASIIALITYLQICLQQWTLQLLQRMERQRLYQEVLLKVGNMKDFKKSGQKIN